MAQLILDKKRGRSSGRVEGARKLPRDSRESPSILECTDETC